MNEETTLSTMFPIHTRRATGAGLVLLALTLAAAPVVRADDIKDGRAALAAGDLDGALKSFEKAAASGVAEGKTGAGQVYLRRRQLDKAMDAFQTAQKMDPSFAWGYYGQGEVLRQRGHCLEALPLLEKATELDRKFPEAQYAYGVCLTELKRYNDAVAAFTPGTRWGPKLRPKFLVGLGNVEMARDSLRAASVYFTTAREEAPNDPEPHRALGDFYMKSRGIAELAIPEYEAAVALDSSDVGLRFSLAQGLDRGERYGQALEQYRRVVTADPDFAPGQYGLGQLLYRAGAADPRRYAEAREPLEAYTRLEPKDGRGWSALGRTYYYLKMNDEAAAALAKAEQLGGLDKDTYTVMGRMYADRKEWGKALAAFEKGTPSGRDMLIIAQMYVLNGQPARADSIYQSLIAKDSTSSDARFAMSQIGTMKFRAQDYPGAVAAFKRRIALDPGNDEAYYYIGLSYKEMKQYPEALAALKQAAALADAKADRHFWLGILYAQSDSVPQARAELRRSLEIDSTGTFAGVAYRQLGFYDLLDKHYDGAIQELERATQLNDKDVQAWVWLGQGHQNTGNRSRALDSYRRALALDPKQADALRGVQSLGGSAAKQGEDR